MRTAMVLLLLAGNVYAAKPDWAGGGKTTTDPEPTVIEVPIITATGQTVSYYPGDDGDLEMGAVVTAPRFTLNGDGTATDALTGFQWYLDGGNYFTRWEEAISFCTGLGFRMPNFKELLSVMDFGNRRPMLPTGHPFVNITGDGFYYYTSTTSPEFDSGFDAYSVQLDTGRINAAHPKSGGGYTLCVR